MSAIHLNLKLMSHSSDILVDKCPRKFWRYKLSNRSWKNELRSISTHEELSNVSSSDPHLDFGSVVGIGTQRYFVDGNYNRAVLSMLSSWDGMLDSENGVRDKKTFYYAMHALDKFTTLRNTVLSDFEVAIFDGKPASELGFIIDCGDGFSYRGFLDLLMLHKRKKELTPYEGKTTKFVNIHEASYRHSGQALGYSLVVDKIAELMGLEISSSFDVWYSIYKSSGMEWELMPFPKTLTHRAFWIKNLLVRKQQIMSYAENNYWPMHGWNCYDFFRPCEYYGECEMGEELIMSMAEEKKDDPKKYQFHFSLQEILETQLARVGG